MTFASIAYSIHGLNGLSGTGYFPWDKSWWKPLDTNPNQMTVEDRIRHLEKAGALLAAEIDRLLRK